MKKKNLLANVLTVGAATLALLAVTGQEASAVENGTSKNGMININKDENNAAIDFIINNPDGKELQVDIGADGINVYLDSTNKLLDSIKYEGEFSGKGNISKYLVYVPESSDLLPKQFNNSKVVSVKGNTAFWGVAEAKGESVKFRDIAHLATKDPKVYNSIMTLADLGIVKGSEGNYFKPDDILNRAQFAAMISRALALEPNGKYPFKDGKDAWFANDIQALSQAGIIKGFQDGTVRGNDKVTRQQAILMLYRAALVLDKQQTEKYLRVESLFADQGKISKEAKPAVNYLVAIGAIKSGKNVNLNPQGEISRKELSMLLTVAFGESFKIQ